MRVLVLQALVDADHIVFPQSGKKTQCYVNPHLGPDVRAGAVQQFWRKWRFGTLIGRERERANAVYLLTLPKRHFRQTFRPPNTSNWRKPCRTH